MSKVIALVNRKGGVGKSSLAIGIAVELAERGQRVLLGDADPQASSQGWAALASEDERASIPTVVGLGEGFHRPRQLDALAQGYDFTLIDTPPHNGAIMRAALAVADVALLPVVAGAFDAWALGDSLELVEQIRTIKPELAAAVVLNRATRARAASARKALGDCGAQILDTWIGHRVDVSDALAAGRGPSTYAPRSKAADEIRHLTDEVMTLLKMPALRLAYAG